MYLVAVRTNAISTPLCSSGKALWCCSPGTSIAQPSASRPDEVSSDHAAKPPPRRLRAPMRSEDAGDCSECRMLYLTPLRVRCDRPRAGGVGGEVLVEECCGVEHGSCSRGERSVSFFEDGAEGCAGSGVAEFFDDGLDAGESVMPLPEESDHSGVSHVVGIVGAMLHAR